LIGEGQFGFAAQQPVTAVRIVKPFLDYGSQQRQFIGKVYVNSLNTVN
jgi:hypothetical protein